ncbi:unnamed protein product [Arabidopsis halleri]
MFVKYRQWKSICSRRRKKNSGRMVGEKDTSILH